jgi:hypothetical protein
MAAPVFASSSAEFNFWGAAEHDLPEMFSCCVPDALRASRGGWWRASPLQFARHSHLWQGHPCVLCGVIRGYNSRCIIKWL